MGTNVGRRASTAIVLLAAVVSCTSIRVVAAQLRAGGSRAFWTGRSEASLSRYEWLRRLIPGSLEAEGGELEIHLEALERSAGAGSSDEFRRAARRGASVLRDLVEAEPLRPETWAGVADYFSAIKIENQHRRVYSMATISSRPEENLEPEDLLQIRALERATAVDPNGFYYRDILGDLCWNAGLRSRALDSYAEAVTLQPDPGQHPFLAAVALDPELETTAVRAMERSVEPPRKADPERVYFNLGYFLNDRQRYGEARKAFEKARAVSAGGVNYYFLEAYAAAHQGQTEEAIRLYRQSLARYPMDLEERCRHHFNLGELLEELGKHGEAAQEVRAALDLMPRNSAALLLLGKIEEKQGMLDEAEDAYVKAAETSKEPITALVNLVEFYRRIGRPSEALIPAQKLVALQPDETIYRKLVQQLASETDTNRAR